MGRLVQAGGGEGIEKRTFILGNWSAVNLRCASGPAETVSFTSNFTDEGPNNNGISFIGNYSIGNNPSGTYTETFATAGSTQTIGTFFVPFLAVTAVGGTGLFGATDNLGVSFNFTSPAGSGTIGGYRIGNDFLSYRRRHGFVSDSGDGSVIDITLSSGDFNFFTGNTAGIDATLRHRCPQHCRSWRPYLAPAV
jgi:hypothetical protein